MNKYTVVYIRDNKEGRIIEVKIEETEGRCEAAAKGWAGFKGQDERFEVCGVE